MCAHSWDATPKPVSYSGLGGEWRMPRSEELMMSGFWEQAGEREAFQSVLLLHVSVFSCVCTCDHECIYVWEPSTHTHSSECWRQRAWPTQQRTVERFQCFSSSSEFCLFPPPPNMTLNPVHTHISTSLHSICIFVSHMTWQNWTIHMCALVRECVFGVLAVFSTWPSQKIL